MNALTLENNIAMFSISIMVHALVMAVQQVDEIEQEMIFSQRQRAAYCSRAYER